MLPHSIFESAALKIERADQHIRDLQAAFEAFSQSHRHTVHVHGNVKGPIYFEIVFDAALPPTLALILGDAIHNLRTALDHATWELLGMDGAKRKRQLQLPSGQNRVDFEAFCKGIETPDQSTIDFLIELAVYPEGEGKMLYWLCKLDNAEKHRIITPVAQAASVARIVFIDLATNKRWESTDITLHPGDDGRSYLKVKPGLGIDCNEHFQTAASIFFGDVEGVPNEPVIPTLVHLRDAVADTLREFRRLVVERNPGIPKDLVAGLVK